MNLLSEKGVMMWKTSRSENYFRRTRTMRLTVSEIADKMGFDIKALKIVDCMLIFKGQIRKTFARIIIFSLLKAGLKIVKIDFDICTRFGGCKFSKKARK
jgi:hypothetical protein